MRKCFLTSKLFLSEDPERYNLLILSLNWYPVNLLLPALLLNSGGGGGGGGGKLKVGTLQKTFQ